MRRAPLLSGLLGLSFLTGTPLAATAAETTTYSAPVISDLNLDPDTDPATPDHARTPGHVTGAVTTDAPYVLVQLERSGGSALPPPRWIDNAGGSVRFDLEAWGYTAEPGQAPLRVVAAGCRTQAVADCESPARSGEIVVPDVDPTVTFPPDRTLELGQPYAVSVSDPQGGGDLRAAWVPDSGSATEQEVARDGSTTLTRLGQGVGTLVVRRCAAPADVDPSRCHDTGVTRRLELDDTVSATGAITSATPVGRAARTVTLTTRTSDPGDHRLTWQLRDQTQGVVASGSADAVVPAARTHAFELELPTTLASGPYTVSGTLSRTSDVGDPFTSTFTTPAFEVDTTAPVVGAPTVSTPTLMPYGDGHLDSVDVTVPVSGESGRQTVRLEALDQDGVAHTFPAQQGGPGSYTFRWFGAGGSGTTVAPGTYTFRARATDRAGNASAWRRGASVTVDSSRLVSHTWRRTVSATGSRIAVSVGRCSTLRSPSSHTWRDSLGLLSGARPGRACRTTTSGLLVSTVHSLRLPVLPQPAGPDRYDSVEVQAYGGASRSRPTSTSTLRYFDAKGAAGSTRTMAPYVGYHEGYVRNAAGMVRPDGTFRWSTATTARRQYDVRQFQVTVTYSVLEAATP